MKNLKSVFLLGFAVIALSACVTPPKPLYYHGSHAKAVYAYLKADDIGMSEQITLMEQTVEKSQSSGLPVAPGVHAHLGLLHFESGNVDTGMMHFETEKNMFPESSQYIDYLLQQVKKDGE